MARRSSDTGGVLSTGRRMLSALLFLAIFAGLARADLTAADYFVRSLPGAPDGPLLKMHAGHVEIDAEHHSHTFFWHFQNRHIANRQRTVIWLNGGPGCSSEDGAMMEIGPYRVKATDKGPKLEYNDGSWDEFANLLFVDNPVGTGYSVVDSNSYVTELPEMANQMITFLEKWFIAFPEYQSDDLYLAGESFAGQHIPYIAKAILERNKGKSASGAWNLKGMIIGNGWISPLDQYPAYLEYAYEKELVMRDSDIAKQLEAKQAVCKQTLDAGGKDHVDVTQCETVLQEILRLTRTPGNNGKDNCVNMYDIRLKDVFPSCGMNWPPDLSELTLYLRRHDVIEALHVMKEKKSGWTECNGAVGRAFAVENSKPSISFLPELIEQVPTLLFSGEQDLICNHVGTENLIGNLNWGGAKGFEVSSGTWAPRQAWTFEGEDAGFWQSARNLTYVLFRGSSHMVPFDYARRSRDMLDRFMGVDIASIGGKPADSRIDGEKGLETSVGGHPNSTAAAEAEQERLQAAKWAAYYKSGEIVLVIVILAAGVWFWYIWKEGRHRSGYKGIFGGDAPMARETPRTPSLGLEGFRLKSRSRDVELADVDVDVDVDGGMPRRASFKDAGSAAPSPLHPNERYSLGSVSDDDVDDEPAQLLGTGKQPVR